MGFLLSMLLAVFVLLLVGANGASWVLSLAVAFSVLCFSVLFFGASGLAAFLTLAVLGASVLWSRKMLRQRIFMRPFMRWFKSSMPAISDTERVALEAGQVFWEQSLLSGSPDWEALSGLPKASLSEEENKFIDQEVSELCAMLKDWDISQAGDLPQEVWSFIKTHRFLGMIIPKEYGGRAFSALAHSAVVLKISSRCPAAGVSVMVPNSLGPAELLLHYGTEEQKSTYLPRLARGEDIPCFALTGLESGSDAANMSDRGIVCYENFEGKRTLGLRLSWNKRYITLAPIATLLGLAVDVFDPEHLLGAQDHVGITLCLIPAKHPGVVLGARHQPMGIAFMNGPTSGKDVFVPMEWVIGGAARIGQGWKMLMECLSVGRSISLPSMSCANGHLAYVMTGAYARLRRQFNVSIGQLEGVEEGLASIAGLTTVMDATRSMTALAVDQGIKPSVASAIAKYHLTEMSRTVMNWAMDIHAGRAIQLGPSNYMGAAYFAVPIGITVEGANILTRNLMIFGQGSLRCHPYLRREIETLSMTDETQALESFDTLIGEHLAHAFRVFSQASVSGFSRHLIFRDRYPRIGGAPVVYLSGLQHLSRILAALTEVAFATLGGKLKRAERLSARLGDLLSYLYLAGSVLKYAKDHELWNDQDSALHVRWALAFCLHEAEESALSFLREMPVRPLAWLLRIFFFPRGRRYPKPSDRLEHELAASVMREQSMRHRFEYQAYFGDTAEDVTGSVLSAFRLGLQTEKLWEKVRASLGKLPASFEERLEKIRERELLDPEEIDLLIKAEKLRMRAIEVDDFVEGV